MKKIIGFFVAIIFLSACSSGKKVEIVITNPLGVERTNEIVEVSKNDVVAKLGLTTGDQLIVTDASSNEVTYQTAVNISSPADSLIIFQATVPANGQAIYTLKKGIPSPSTPKVFGRLVPERKDDFAWENDKIAFRMYGPALQATGEISDGIDVWVKRTDKLVIDKWYADDLGGVQSYHEDHGEGLDFYKVGPTLGGGATVPYLKDALWLGQNFISYEVLENGPLRITFKLNYAPYKADTIEVIPVRILSLDAGSQFNKISTIYQFAGSELPVATGVITRNNPDEALFIDPENHFGSYKEPADSANGILYTAFVNIEPYSNIELKQGHLLGFTTVKPDQVYSYFAGGGWSKADFPTFEDWNAYVADFFKRKSNLLQVAIK